MLALNKLNDCVTMNVKQYEIMLCKIYFTGQNDVVEIELR